MNQPLARVEAAHGVRGALRTRWQAPLAALTAWPLRITLQHHRLGLRPFVVGAIRPTHADAALLHLVGLTDREQAAAWRGAVVLIPTVCAPALAEHEIYLFNLLHKRALDRDGQLLGEIVATYDYGAGDVLGIASADQPAKDELLVNLRQTPIRSVDEGSHTVVLDGTVADWDTA